MPKFVLCKFRPDDARIYTYLLDGHDVAVGDQVKVPDNRSDGSKRVHVAGFTDDEPPFACKPILGRIDPDAEILAKSEAGAADPIPDALTAPVVDF